jgi:hypothetical protein
VKCCKQNWIQQRPPEAASAAQGAPQTSRARRHRRDSGRKAAGK